MPDTEHPPRVSVICIFLNAERFLEEAIESVLSQDFTDFELLLVDDGSTDRSRDIALEYAAGAGPQIRYLHHPGHANRGTSPSHNLGLRQARGEFLAFIDSDDVWRPGKLSGQLAILDSHPDCGMVCGRVNYWSSWDGGEDEIIQTGGISDGKLAPPAAFGRIYPVGRASAPGPSEVMIRRSLVDDVGGFEERFTGMFDDQALFAKLYLLSGVYFSDRIWVDYRLHAASITANAARAGGELAHRKAFFIWLDEYLSTRSQLVGMRIIARVKYELLLLHVPLVWKLERRLRDLLLRLIRRAAKSA